MADLSILPDDYLEMRVQRRTNLISLTLFVIVMGAVVAAYYVTDRQRSEVKTLKTQVDAQFEDAAKRLEQLEQLQQRKAQMLRKAEVSGALIERVPRSVVLAEMINNMPATVSLLQFDLSTKVMSSGPRPSTAMERAKKDRKAAEQAAGPQVPVKRASIYIIGLAPTDVEVAQFMASLSQSRLFREVNLVFSEEDTLDGRQVRRFRVEMLISPEVDMQSFEPLRADKPPNQNPLGETFAIDADGKIGTPTNAPVAPTAPAGQAAAAKPAGQPASRSTAQAKE
ncbi:MAG: PilN domain-containing protein [Phycisphaeraceae bacterium]|nr:PilN domain-containing protein [Phycisphaeraceae bacterium]